MYARPLGRPLALVALAAFLVAGCAKKPPQAPAAPPAPAAKETPVPTPTPTPTPTPPPAPKEATVTIGDLDMVHFAYDSYALDDAARAILDADAKKLRASGGLKVVIEGHCDERGTVEYNQALGEKRADAVRQYLQDAGIPANRLTTISYGKERPLDEGHDEAAWAKNRRAQFAQS